MTTHIARTGALLAVTALAVTLAGCDPIDDPNPQPDRRPAPNLASGVVATLPTPGGKITMNWYSDQPYRAKWKITKRDGSIASGVNAQNPGTYDTGQGEYVAGGAFAHDINVGDVELIFTLTIVMSTREATGWVKVTNGPKEQAGKPGMELAFQDADKSLRQGTCNYHYKPKG